MLALPDSQKGGDEDAIILIGDIVPNLFYKIIPRRAHGPGSYLKIVSLLLVLFYVLLF